SASGATAYTFTGLTNRMTYTFKVRAINAVGFGDAASTTATPEEPDISYPESSHPYENNLTKDSPGNLQTYTYPGDATSLRVTFAAETKVENNYDKIYITDASGANIPGSPFTNTALAGATVIVPGKTVKTYITSDSSVTYYGYSITKIEASTITVPSAPQNFTAIPGDRQVTLIWEAPSSDGGSAILDYQVSKDNGSTWVSTSNKTEYSFTGLINGMTCTFKVRAKNAVGFGAEDIKTASPSVPEFIYPEAEHPYANNLTINSPGNLQTYTYPGDAASLRVTFSAETKVENNYDKIFVMDANDVNIPGSPFTNTALAGATVIVPGKTVKIYITSDSSVNYYGFKVINIEASAVAAPSAPQNLKSLSGNEQVTLSWEAPSNDGGRAITVYQVSSNNGATWQNASGSGEHTFTGLTNGITYIFKVRAENSVGLGAEATISATPKDSSSPFPESAHPYANNLTITTPGNLQEYTHPGGAASLKVTFSGDTKVENNYDKIFIMDANDNNIPGSPFTNIALAGATVIVPGDTLKIYITSDSSVAYYGYKVTSIEAVAEQGHVQWQTQGLFLQGRHIQGLPSRSIRAAI
ncbi:MAG: fibronectin type III domain-containing protein, partial [Clostridiales bacterium]|nr:fibronectin type III domain-containing protein [Clostridiales bacterium]